jgi:formamidopyrimidine-DNA glycosylase
VTAARRHGKLLLIECGGRPTIGLRFGMTGRLVVDGHAPIHRLEYGSGRDDPAWDRVTFHLDGGGRVRINVPRRLGGVEVEPDLSRPGPDAVTITPSQLGAALSGPVALKARLLDQSRVAGIGNLIADETLWRAGLSPLRPAGSMDRDETARLVRQLRSTIVRLSAAGGSHRGALQADRGGGGSCPRCGGPLRREQVGGRTTIWCPTHQQ